MAGYDTSKQKLFHLADGGMGEMGRWQFTSGNTVSVPTKLKHVAQGFGLCESSGAGVFATPGEVSNGMVTFTRRHPIETQAEYFQYLLRGH